MSKHALRSEGAPLDSYSRVTNAARFQDLHRIALERLDQLESEFDVRRTQPYEVGSDLTQVPFARPAVHLAPASPSAAPIAVAFTSFPGLFVQSGRWTVHAFPACGCDACAETLEGESQRFLELVEDVIAGRFRESINIPWMGSSAQRWELWSANHRQGGGRALTRKRARELIDAGGRSYEWNPWPPR